MEAELFGYVRGAFSGADRARQGLLESASGGTVFLDEVGELPLSLQTKLLGALERRRVRAASASNTAAPIDVRVIAATNKNLGREVNQERFRADLFYRLAVVRLRVPPLRERKEDIPHAGARPSSTGCASHYGERVPATLSAVVLSRMSAHDWPGNVRELRNAVERAALKIREAARTSRPTPRPAPRREPPPSRRTPSSPAAPTRSTSSSAATSASSSSARR